MSTNTSELEEKTEELLPEGSPTNAEVEPVEAEVDFASQDKSTEKSEEEDLVDIATVWERLSTLLGADAIRAALEFLARSVPTRELWQLLSSPKYLPLQTRLTKGFQRTSGTLRQTPVRNRLVKEMSDSSVLTFHLLRQWAETSPSALKALREFEGDATITEQVPQLWRRFGTEALFWSLFIERRQTVLDAWAAQLASGETLPAESDVPQETATESSSATKLGATPAKREKLLSEASEAAEKWQKRAETLESKLRVAELALTHERSENSKQVQELRAVARQEENRYATEHQKLLELDKSADRTTRKLKSTEKQLEELETENKRLKKQVRQQQELNEEQKKEAVGLRAKIEALETAVQALPQPAAPPSLGPSPSTLPGTLRFYPAAPTVAPQEQQFIWDADGHTIRVTPRDIKRAVDRNDENFVFALIQAMDALRQTSSDGSKLLLDRLRDYDRYYAQVLTAHTTRILVDASNVARYEKNRFGKGQIRFLLAMRQELRRRNCFPIRFIADASLPYNIDLPEELLAMVKRSELELSAAGQEADDILAREARRSGAFVVSNDRTFHHKVSPGFEPPRVGFQFYDAYVVVDEF